METVLNLSPSIASIYIRHPIICQSCPDMSDDKTVRRQSGFHNKSDNKVGDAQSPNLQGQLLTPLR